MVSVNGAEATREAILTRRLRNVRKSESNPRRYEGTLRVVWPDCGLHDDVCIAVEFGDDVKVEPSAYVLGGVEAEMESHASGGQLCLWLPTESRWKADDPDALDTYLDHVEQHVRRMLIREADPEKRWPGDSRAHGVWGWVDYLVEKGATEKLAVFATFAAMDSSMIGRHGRRQPCPCGSGKRVGHCHVGEIRELVASIAAISGWSVNHRAWMEQLRVGRGAPQS